MDHERYWTDVGIVMVRMPLTFFSTCREGKDHERWERSNVFNNLNPKIEANEYYFNNNILNGILGRRSFS